MLKDNAIPTLFDHNKDKQLIKKTSTLSRNEIAQKKQYCVEAFELYDKFEKFEYENNSKEIQTTQRPEILRHKQISFIKKNLFSVTSKRILKCTLVKMK